MHNQPITDEGEIEGLEQLLLPEGFIEERLRIKPEDQETLDRLSAWEKSSQKSTRMLRPHRNWAAEAHQLH